MTPTYNGPTNAEQFAEDLSARRSLARHDLPIPPQLSHDAITKRFAFISMERNDDGIPCHATFLDGSAVAMNDRGRWTVIA